MSYHVQINPSAEAIQIGADLAEVLEEYAIDFEIRYCALVPGAGLLNALYSLQPSDEDEKRAIVTLLRDLEAGDGVELLFSR